MNHARTLAAALLLTVAPACATAPPAGDPVDASRIRVGQTLGGTLSDSDARADDGSYYDAYTLAGRAGQTIVVTQRSDDFDAYLSVGRMSGGTFEEIESDDDGAGGTDARLVFRVDASGDYVVRANSLSEGETGRYTLEVTDGGAPTVDVPAGDVVTAQLDSAAVLMAREGLSRRGGPVRGSLAQGASTDVEVRLAAGGTVALVGVCGVQCSDLDLVVFGPGGGEVGSDLLPDDAPIVMVENARAGTYRVRVSMPACGGSTCGFGVQAFGVD